MCVRGRLSRHAHSSGISSLLAPPPRPRMVQYNRALVFCFVSLFLSPPVSMDTGRPSTTQSNRSFTTPMTNKNTHHRHTRAHLTLPKPPVPRIYVHKDTHTPPPKPPTPAPLPQSNPLHRRRLLLLAPRGVRHHHPAAAALLLLPLEEPLDGVGRLLRGLVRGLALQAHRLEQRLRQSVSHMWGRLEVK